MICSGIILSGGRGRRAGGADKGRLPYADSTLVEQVLERITPQVDDITLSANRNLEWYKTLGVAVVGDERADYQGPLAGLEAALPLCQHSLVLLVACDTPLLPTDLAARLQAPLTDGNIDLSYASANGRDHYLAAVIRTELLPGLRDYLDRGGRSVRGWYGELRTACVNFDDRASAFANFNSPNPGPETTNPP